jgi:hypothetical protein
MVVVVVVVVVMVKSQCTDDAAGWNSQTAKIHQHKLLRAAGSSGIQSGALRSIVQLAPVRIIADVTAAHLVQAAA